MSDHITLMGAEDVSRAGRNMQSAAERMNDMPMNLGEVLDRHQRFLDDWLERFEAILAKARGASCR